ncbi:MAG: hypothetical protein LAKADJCE_00239 [Candidatus Argoarchaeum ethanivorans]|uniref:Uncharacterized protein n=1 Tax=Candidatus Argoarchaeum ethanivorans TaxID=2608793 RepID=A0A811TC38_9EURY|nr:MAG: hypothetical protein LAKADJCE_00239 [Candidatus Argoarchaeum ethanivorans]
MPTSNNFTTSYKENSYKQSESSQNSTQKARVTKLANGAGLKWYLKEGIEAILSLRSSWVQIPSLAL